MKSAIVVGSGLAGLSAAHYLRKGGWQVTVLESEARLGGRVESEMIEGYLVDLGPTAVSTHYRRFIELMNESGVGGSLVESSNKMGFVRNGVIHEIDGRSPLSSFAATKLLSIGEKFRLIMGMIRVLKDCRGAVLPDGIRYAHRDHQSIASYLRLYFGEELILGFFDPLVHCFTYGDKEEASLIELFCGLDSASGKLVNVKGGLIALPQALARNLDLRLSSPVRSVNKLGGRVQVDYVDASGALQQLTADGCVITTTFQQACALHRPLAEEGPALLAQTRIATSHVVYLGYTKRTQSQVVAVTFPEREIKYVTAMFLDHNKAEDRAPPGHSLITVYFNSNHDATVGQWSEAERYACAEELVLRFFPELRGRLNFKRQRRYPRASHLAPVGHFKAVQQFLDRHSANDPVQVGGDYFSVPSQETAVEWGYRAAANLLQQTG